MPLLNHFSWPCNSYFGGFAIAILTIYLVPNVRAEYDCSAKDDGWYYDPEFCHIYWRCIHGSSEEFECASGTAWDHHENRCNWLDSVDCSRAEKTTAKVANDDDDEHNNEDENSEEPPVTTVTKNKKKRKKNRTLDPNKRMLDGDNNDGNDATDYPTTSRKKADTESVQSTMNNNQAAGSPAIDCQPTGIYIIPDPNECNAYYQCDKGTRTRLNCPERKLFDVDKRECNEFERVNCGTRALNLAEKNQCIGKRDGIHPDTERDCRFYYQCVSQNKMREAKCSGDQKFSSYIGQCGPANHAPMPCGSFVPGNVATTTKRWPVEILLGYVLGIFIVVLVRH